MCAYDLQAQGFRANERLNFQGHGDLIIPEETAVAMVEGCQHLIDKKQLLVYQPDPDPNPRLIDAVAVVNKILLKSGWIYISVTMLTSSSGQVMTEFFERGKVSVWPAFTRESISGGNPPVLFLGRLTHFTADIKKGVSVGHSAAEIMKDFELCDECAGSGVDRRPDGNKCRHCAGSGFKSMLCVKCAGSGRMSRGPRSIGCDDCSSTGRVTVRITK